MVTPKQKAVWSATIAAVTSALAWLANTPPEQQNALLGPLVDAMPVNWRPTIGAAMKLLSSIAIVYSTIQASHSGPATKPTTDTQTGAAVKALAIAFLCMASIGCVNVKEMGANGKPVTVFHCSANVGYVKLTTKGGTTLEMNTFETDKTHQAIGNMVSKGIISTGTAFATSGVSKFIKP